MSLVARGRILRNNAPCSRLPPQHVDHQNEPPIPWFLTTPHTSKPSERQLCLICNRETLFLKPVFTMRQECHKGRRSPRCMTLALAVGMEALHDPNFEFPKPEDSHYPGSPPTTSGCNPCAGSVEISRVTDPLRKTQHLSRTQYKGATQNRTPGVWAPQFPTADVMQLCEGRGALFYQGCKEG